jgi:hypothetical protein
MSTQVISNRAIQMVGGEMGSKAPGAANKYLFYMRGRFTRLNHFPCPSFA